MGNIVVWAAARQPAHLVSNVTDAQHAAPTPCPQYQVADLLEHIGTMARAFTEAARKQTGPLPATRPACPPTGAPASRPTWTPWRRPGRRRTPGRVPPGSPAWNHRPTWSASP